MAWGALRRAVHDAVHAWLLVPHHQSHANREGRRSMNYVVAALAVIAIVVIGSQLMLMVPEGWPVTVVAVLTFVVAVWAGRFIIRSARR
jgi:uncharacterized membrane protein